MTPPTWMMLPGMNAPRRRSMGVNQEVRSARVVRAMDGALLQDEPVLAPSRHALHVAAVAGERLIVRLNSLRGSGSNLRPRGRVVERAPVNRVSTRGGRVDPVPDDVPSEYEVPDHGHVLRVRRIGGKRREV